MLQSISVVCLLLVFLILSPSLSFENGIDVTFHFSSVFTAILSLVFFPALLGLSWLMDSFATMRIDVEREEEVKAAMKAFTSDPKKEALHRLDPAARGRIEH